MSSLFSVSKLLGKARKAKKGGGPLTRTGSSVTMDKATTASITSPSLIDVAAPRTPPPPPPPPTTTTTTLVASPLAGGVDTEKIDSSFELDDDMLEQLPPVATTPPPSTPPAPKPEETAVQIRETAIPTNVVEESTHTEALQPERKLSESEMGWTHLDGEISEGDEAIPTNGGTETSSSENVVEQTTAGPEESEQPGPTNDIAQLLADNKKLTEQVRSAQETLHHLHEQLAAQSSTITTLNHQLSQSQASLETLTQEKEEAQRIMEAENQAFFEEIERMKGILDVERSESRAKIEGVEREREDLQAKLEEQDDRIDALEERLTEAQEEAGEVYARNHELETDIERTKEDLAEATDRLAERDNHIQMLEMNHNNENTAARLLKLQSAINSTERQNRVLMDQIHQQANELQARRGNNHSNTSWLSKPPTTNGAHSRVEGALRAINLLNDEIYQTAAAMTDQLEGIAKRFVTVEDDGGRLAVAEYLKSVLGAELLKTLQDEAAYSAEEYNHFIIQVGLQGCLSACCMRTITSWYPLEWEYGNFLAALYERIRGTGGQETALRWRAATQKSCFLSTDRNTRLVAFLTEQINAVLAVCGWSKESGAEKMVEGFAHKLSEIASLSTELNGYTTTSGKAGELEGLLVDSGMVYDPEEMSNDAPFDSEMTDRRRMEIGMPPDETVVCTVGLGLKWAEEDEFERLLVKPKVVLYGALL